ncbi:hypothetical protein GCM10010145_47300 [Streptomyces ruber]|uniref:Uncharacterized protein n=1 Tax=Streptomyces ruber TaxID=83378 RepID=A0A918BIX5_9ACTN|nr:hypothetical protein GCM10010145_47300 [Streptomyces ruber]
MSTRRHPSAGLGSDLAALAGVLNTEVLSRADTARAKVVARGVMVARLPFGDDDVHGARLPSHRDTTESLQTARVAPLDR